MDKIKEVIEMLEQQDLDGILIVKQENVNYISNFTDEASYVLITKNNLFFITDGRFFELANKSCKNFEIINWQKDYYNLFDAVKDLCINNNILRLGFEEDWLTYGLYQKLKDTMKYIDLVPTKDIIENLRYIKSPKEIEIIREASKITDKGFNEILNYIKVGMSEKQISARLEYILKLSGADGVGFDTILISGKKTSLPHGKPDDKKIEDGDLITMDFGALYKDYTSDMTRTIIVGKPSNKQIQIYNLVKEAENAALKTIKAGISSDVPDKAVRKILKNYIEYYYPGMGHGIGRDLHEAPFISNKGGYIIEENCVITIEPGLYIPGWGGVRMEDSIIVTPSGYELLTFSPKELICI